MNTTQIDPHTQLRALYAALLSSQERFDEFKHLLSQYDGVSSAGEPADAAAIRARVNARVRDWTGLATDEISATQLLQWRAILVDERVNVAISPWKEANTY